jgi:hypothetical protein
VGDCLRLLFEHGYNAGYSIEPHMWAVIHLGQVAGVDNAQALWNNYLHYGQKLEALYTRVSDAARI